MTYNDPVIPGEKHGKLIAVCMLKKRMAKRLSATWLCVCGRRRNAPVGRVRKGYIRSCGCDRIENMRAANTQHGGKYSPEYSTWAAIKTRCLNTDSKDYPRYGGAGIKLHKPWARDFASFLKHVGKRPFPAAQIDRIDNRKGYIPGNVKWSSAKEQSENRKDSWRVLINGVIYLSVEDAGRKIGVSDTTIVRWCDGYSDPRRPHLGPTAPKKNCKRWRVYGG